jgi:2-amino-4-hydroxy-6-hydroxymethyldihydropteridine diphosphokinase
MESLGVAPTTAYLGLGSNVGDRKANLERALELLAATQGIRVLRSSSIYETEPWGLAEQPQFLNSALEIQTFLEPATLLAAVKAIEAEMGRVPTLRYGPRNIDVDLLLYGNMVIDWETPDLQIPHSRMLERAFVLIPLAEIAGQLRHPAANRPIADLAGEVAGGEGVKIFARWLPGQS